LPNRMIRESCRTSPTLDGLSDGAERLFWRLTTVADDFGRFEADPRVLLATCFPLKVGTMKVETVARWFAEVVACSLVQTYVSGSKHLAFFVTWEKHQYTRAKASKYPEPGPDSIRSHVLTDSPVVTERHGSTEQHEKHGVGRRAPVTDDQFIESLKTNPAYRGIDIGKELARMDAWFLTPKGAGRKKTRRFILNWLNKAEAVVTVNGNHQPEPVPFGYNVTKK
jgi:hypothetical protein